jgi:hypothetical protein
MRIKTPLVPAFLVAGAFLVSCASSTTSEEGSTGSLALTLELANGETVDRVEYVITRGGMEPMDGFIDTSAPGATASVEVFGLEPGDGYRITMTAEANNEVTRCTGATDFAVEAGVSTEIMVVLKCKSPPRLGGVRVNGKFNICAELTKMVAAPLQTSVGNSVDLSAAGEDAEDDDIVIRWTSEGGDLGQGEGDLNEFTCTEEGEASVTAEVSDDGFDHCVSGWTIAITCVGDGGGTGGTGGGAGGAGGAPPTTANVTAVHLAPEVPTAEDTTVSIFVNGEEAGITIVYGQSTGKVELPAGTYDIGIGLPGGDAPLLALPGVELADGDDIVVVAYRTNDELPVNVFVFVNSTDGLAAGSGRVVVGHGANDPALDPVNISTGSADTEDCATLIPEFAFGTTFPETGGDNLDVPAATYRLGFDVAEDECPEVGPVDVPVTEGVVSILVAVDEDTTDATDGGGLNPELWAIIPDAEDPQPIRTVQTN